MSGGMKSGGMTSGGKSSVIVVGAGPAGCVVSRRLVEAGHQVTLLEAGAGEPIPDALRSPDWFDAMSAPGWLWDNVSATRVDGQPIENYLRGRGLGGCSSVNAMIGLAPTALESASYVSMTARGRVLDMVPRSVVELGPLAAALSQTVRVEQAPLLMENGQRRSAYDVYLADEPTGAAERLDIRTSSEVARLMMNSGRRITGVELESGERLGADHVVVCAGAIHSPALLLRSGVINPHIGVGLMDHPAVPFTLQLTAPGPTGTPASTGIATWSSSVGGDDDLQVMVMEHLGKPEQAATQQEAAQQHLGQIMVALMSVQSTGSVAVDNNGAPVVNFNMLDDRVDRVRLRHGVRKLVQILETKPFGALVCDVFVDERGGGLGDVPVGRKHLADEANDDEILDAWMREHLGAYVHASCSCRLGSAVGLGGVVRGWQGVSVIDASVIPHIPRVNTQLPTMMLAETQVDGLINSLEG